MKKESMDRDDREERILRRARAGLGPSASRRKATLARLSSNLSLAPPSQAPLESPAPTTTPPASTLGSHPATQGVAHAAGRFSLQAMVAGVVVGSLVGFGAGLLVTSHGSPFPAPQGGRSTSSGAGVVDQARPDQALNQSVKKSPTEAAAAPVAQEEASPGTHPSTTRRLHSTPRKSLSPEAEPTFDEELSYVRRAQSALRRGDGLLALRLMRSLDESQPNGALLAERNVTRVLALCQLGRTEEAGLVARRVLSTDSTATVYRRRLAGSCAGASLPQPQQKKE